MTWRDKKLHISIGTIAAVTAAVWASYPQVKEVGGEVFESTHVGFASVEQVDLIAANLEQTQKDLTTVIIESNLSRLNEELGKIRRALETHPDDEYLKERRDEIEQELEYWKKKRDCHRDPNLC